MNEVDGGVRTQWLTMLAQAEAQLSPLAAAQTWQRDLALVRDRLDQRRPLVALFGAFSAGKSSLLNALLDADVLAVSPNPTTATVTHIEAAQDGVPEVRLIAKTAEQMWADVERALAAVHRSAVDLEQAVAVARTLRVADFSGRAREAASFLRAVADGFIDMSPKLGLQWDIRVDELRRYTVEERLACYLQRVDLARSDARLQGDRIFADTPGVDSVHRRHTGVAFAFMQRADAVMYVLYYTHAFTRADKDFLQQWAGVQETAGTDKLWVVINAVDLAKSTEERAAVRDRVQRELIQLGIRNPRVYEVSSLYTALARRLEHGQDVAQTATVVRQKMGLAQDELPSPDALRQASGVPELSAALTAYLNQAGEQLAADAAQRAVRVVRERLAAEVGRRAVQQHATATELARRTEEALAFAASLNETRHTVDAGTWVEEAALTADWDELVFHCGQRIRMRFPALFREAFHPGRFRDGQRVRQQLADAATELSESLQRQIEIEVRTFALRANHGVTEVLRRQIRHLHQQLGAYGFGAGVYEVLDGAEDVASGPSREQASRQPAAPGLVVDEARLASPEGAFDVAAQAAAAGARWFRSGQQFFEQGGQQALLAEVEPMLLGQVRKALVHGTTVVRLEAIDTVRGRITALLRAVHRAVLAETSDDASSTAVDDGAWRTALDWFEDVFVLTARGV